MHRAILALSLTLAAGSLSLPAAEQAIMVDRTTDAVTAPAAIDFSATTLTLPATVTLDTELAAVQADVDANQMTTDAHAASLSNPHSVTATQVGLGSVDDTADLDKPISTATQTALDGKATSAQGALAATATQPADWDSLTKIETATSVDIVDSSELFRSRPRPGLACDGVTGQSNLGDVLDRDMGADWGVVGWIRTGDDSVTILEKGSAAPHFNLTINAGGFLVAFAEDGSANSVSATSSVVVNDGDWHFFALSVDVSSSTGWALTVDDGAAVTANPTSVGDLGNNDPLLLAVSGSTYFKGNLSEIGFIHFAPSVAELIEIRNQGLELFYQNRPEYDFADTPTVGWPTTIGMASFTSADNTEWSGTGTPAWRVQSAPFGVKTGDTIVVTMTSNVNLGSVLGLREGDSTAISNTETINAGSNQVTLIATADSEDAKFTFVSGAVSGVVTITNFQAQQFNVFPLNEGTGNRVYDITSKGITGTISGGVSFISNLVSRDAMEYQFSNANFPEIENEKLLQNWRAGGTKLKATGAGSFDIVCIGDSWTQNQARLAKPLRDLLTPIYGNGGVGWFGLGHYTDGSTSTDGCADSADVSGTKSAGWTQVSNPTHAISGYAISSSTIGRAANLTISTGQDAAEIHYMDRAGDFRYSIDGGTIWTTISGGGTDAYLTVTVAGWDSTKTTLDIEVETAALVELMGVYFTNTTGIRVNKCGRSGGLAFYAVNYLQEASMIEALQQINAGFVTIMFGTNEYISSTGTQTPEAMRGYIETLISRVRAANPDCDVLVIAPSDNGVASGAGYTIEEYAAASRRAAFNGGAAFLDLRQTFGDFDLYQFGGARPLFNSDDIHPSTEGGYVIGDAVNRALK